jgi:hypothetical protein
VLFWGPLPCVEDVTLKEKPEPKAGRAMLAFGTYLRENARPARDKGTMQQPAVRLAHAMRDEIGPSFQLKPTPLDPNGKK